MKLSLLALAALVVPAVTLPGDIRPRFRFLGIPQSIPIPTGTGLVRHGNQTNYYHRLPFNGTTPRPPPKGTAIGPPPKGTAIGTAAPSPTKPPTTASPTSSSMGGPSPTSCPSRVTALRPIVTGNMADARKRWALRRGHPEGACPETNPEDI